MSALTQQVSQLTKAQTEARKVPLSKPILAALDGILLEVDFSQHDIELVRRCLRLVDSLQEPDDAVGSFLPVLFRQAQATPHLSDSRLLSQAIEQFAVHRTLHLPAVAPAPALGSSLTRGPTLLQPVVSALPARVATAPEGTGYCFRCGRGDHDRATDCKHDTTRTGELILPGQQARFAPAHWKARYGFNSQGYPIKKASS